MRKKGKCSRFIAALRRIAYRYVLKLGFSFLIFHNIYSGFTAAVHL
jgi:hypothetical protein